MKKLLIIIFLIHGSAQAQTFIGEWKDVGGGVRSSRFSYSGVNSMAVDTFHHIMYVGGAFDTAGTVLARNLAKWDGVKWDSVFTYTPIPPDTTGIASVFVIDSTLYIHWRDRAIGKWDGHQYQKIGRANDRGVITMTEWNGNLVVGGILQKLIMEHF